MLLLVITAKNKFHEKVILRITVKFLSTSSEVDSLLDALQFHSSILEDRPLTMNWFQIEPGAATCSLYPWDKVLVVACAESY